MKIMGRALIGLAATILFMSGILFIVNGIGGAKENDADDYRSAYRAQEEIKTQQQTVGSKRSDAAQDYAALNKSNTQQAAGRKDGKEVENTKNSFRAVSLEYFSDAVFIGDSRTVGMQQSGLIPNAAYYAKVGIGIGEILSSRFIKEGGMALTLPEALRRHSFGKVYVMVGINDMSAGDADWFASQYKELLRIVRQIQPNAIIYIQGNIPMSYYKQDLSGALNNANLAERNQVSGRLADNQNIFYLDIASVYADANGHMLPKYTSDGLHVRESFYPLWADYLLQHAIVRG